MDDRFWVGRLTGAKLPLFCCDSVQQASCYPSEKDRLAGDYFSLSFVASLTSLPRVRKLIRKSATCTSLVLRSSP